MNCTVYKDGKIVFRGSVYKARSYLHTTPYKILDIIDSGKAFKGYIVESELSEERRNERYESIVKRLNLYGNTIVSTDYKYIVNRLRRNGWKIKSKKYFSEDESHYIIEGEKIN